MSQRSFRRPPSPRGLPLLGHTHQYASDTFAFVEKCRDLGPVVEYEVLGRTFYQLNDPADIEHVLVQNNQNYVKGELFQELLAPFVGEGLLTAEGEQWREQRHRVQPAFHPERIAAYGDLMVTETLAGIEGWRDGEVRNVNAEMMAITLEIVGQALFGVDVGDEIGTVGDAMATIMAQSEKVYEGLVPRTVPTPGRRRYDAAVERMSSVVEDVIAERRRNPTEDDVVSMILRAAPETDDAALRDEVITLLAAGHETTALALTFTFWLVSQHPAVEERLLAELAEVVPDGRPTAADVADLTYTEQVVKESMRLYPPVWGIIREAVAEDEVGGYTVPPGTTISMNQWGVHRNPRFYDDPLAFRPERWTDDFEKSLPRLAYFPFAAGPRRCIGDRFAMLEAQLLLATVLSRYHLELVSPTSLDLAPSITARPRDPVRMRLHERGA